MIVLTYFGYWLVQKLLLTMLLTVLQMSGDPTLMGGMYAKEGAGAQSPASSVADTDSDSSLNEIIRAEVHSAPAGRNLIAQNDRDLI